MIPIMLYLLYWVVTILILVFFRCCTPRLSVACSFVMMGGGASGLVIADGSGVVTGGV